MRGSPCRPPLGVILLDTRFPRPRGDIGNPRTWPFPVLYARVPGATVARAVTRDAFTRTMLAPLLGALRKLLDDGACLISTSCGLLSPYQAELQACSPVPVISSSLTALAAIQSSLAPGERVGVITFDSRALGGAHLSAAGADPGTPVVGVEQGRELHRVISGDLRRLDRRRARRDVLDAGIALQRRVQGLAAVLLECTNMPPYRAALARRLRLPVYDIVTTLSRAYAGLGNGPAGRVCYTRAGTRTAGTAL